MAGVCSASINSEENGAPPTEQMMTVAMPRCEGWIPQRAGRADGSRGLTRLAKYEAEEDEMRLRLSS
ncbi:hypothetical protein PAAG_11045 [Paracoccidioides lutzii Pb01]|uniref:Uncharacterized protein n=1 Tax=Paracoccidioides lutzii (strain ATCC MYA-826 / Pb01) TaxID=502779 RepID=A0A0A2V2T6_PARBA|nr:hypothetical protein PAAG_11045 [Paracoccidioides lutzii Pb01]KGQ02096.1 hypothetical protein PAAG_11045 [Paracoccidioides lutzii Pb01]